MDAASESAFRALQRRLVPLWHGMTVRSVDSMERGVLVISSISVDMPASIAPLIPAYEERYLFMVGALARSPHTQVVYVTSQPVLPRLVDYYLGLAHGPATPDIRDRVTVVAVCEGTATPLARKLLDRPLLLDRLRGLVAGLEHTLILPFMVTGLEAELALRLDMPLYGPAPSLVHLGSKTGSREVFAEAGVPMARGVHGVRTRDDVIAAIGRLHTEAPRRRYVVKTDVGYGGYGNALVDLEPAAPLSAIPAAVAALAPGDSSVPVDQYLAELARTGGIVEEWVDGDEVASPSIQLRTSPLGDVEVLSTHDQVLGGPGGLTFQGCRFPAHPEFIADLTRHGRAIGEVLARRGVIGRFGIDFVMVRQDGTWRPYAIEINLRSGGTTHPTLTLLGLTDGTYDEQTGDFVARTGPKYYYATDHLERPEYAVLTPDDVLDLVEGSGLGWDEGTQTGVALHMVSAVAVGGRLGATAIAGSPEDADLLFRALQHCLDDAVGAPPSQ